MTSSKLPKLPEPSTQVTKLYELMVTCRLAQSSAVKLESPGTVSEALNVPESVELDQIPPVVLSFQVSDTVMESAQAYWKALVNAKKVSVMGRNIVLFILV